MERAQCRCIHKWVTLLLLLLIGTVVAFDVYFHRVAPAIVKRGLGALPLGAEYYARVRTTAAGWMVHPPNQGIHDVSNRLVIVDYIRGFDARPVHHWMEDGLFSGNAVLAHTGREEDLAIVDAYLARRLDLASGKSRSGPSVVDEALFCWGILQLPPHYIRKCQPALRQMLGFILERVAADGTVPYRDGHANRLVDTVGLICPFLSSYGALFEDARATNLAIRQIDEYAKHGVWQGLPFHAYSPMTDHPPMGAYGWGRGTGWYGMGLVDTYSALRGETAARQRLSSYIGQLALGLDRCQRQDGGWGSLLTTDASPFDSSATALAALVLANGIMTGALPGKYSSNVDRAMRKLASVTRDTGAVDFSEGPCLGVGHYSTIYGPSPFTQGIVLRLLSSWQPEWREKADSKGHSH